MKRIRLVVWVSLLTGLILGIGIIKVKAQGHDFHNLPLYAPLPQVMLEKPSQRFRHSSIDTYDFERAKRLALEATKGEICYSLYYAFSGGDIWSGSILHEYVNRIIDTLLVADPELRKKISVFITNDSYVNAFASSEGVMFVTMGLLARLHNESELAFILAHEISHFELHHSSRSISFNYDLESDPRSYSTLGGNALGMKRHQYSRNLEMEADSAGLKRYLGTNYNLASLDSVFYLLHLADYALFPLSFNFGMLGLDSLNIPVNQKCMNPPSLIESLRRKDDTLSTHPATFKRYEKMKRATANMRDSGRKPFLVDQALFVQVRDYARYLTIRQLIHEREYQQALLLASTVNDVSPGEEIRVLIAEALYGMSFYKALDMSLSVEWAEEVLEIDEETYGALYQCNCYFDGLNATDLNVLSLAYAWATYTLYPESPQAKKVLDYNLYLMVGKNKFGLEYTPDLSPKLSFPKASTQDEPVWDTDDIASREKAESKDFSRKFIDKLVMTHDFQKYLSTYNTDGFRKPSGDGIVIDDELEITFNSPQEYALGINSVIVVNPKVIYVSSDFGEQFEVDNTEKAELALLEAFEFVSKEWGVKTHLLDLMLMQPTDTQAFQDMSVLSRWFSEYPFEFHDHQYFLMNGQEAIDEVVERYGTPYALYTTLIYSRIPPTNFIYMIYIPVLNPITWPYYFYETIFTRPVTAETHILANVQTGEILLVDAKFTRSSSSNKGLVYSHINDLMWQISRKGKK